MAPTKLIVIGAVNGQFREVFEKITKLHAKNGFALALIVGNLFADLELPQDDVTDLINGQIEVPLPTYFALSERPLPPPIIEKLESDGSDEVCHNLFFLGKRTTIKTSEDVRIVALGGSLDPNLPVGISKDKYPPFYNEGDAKVLRGANTADILITSQWPEGVDTGSNVAMPGKSSRPQQYQCITGLDIALKPRYHFSTSTDSFYEREPFFHAKDADSTDPGYAITRFISLAQYGSSSKAKWIYAFTLDPKSENPATIPPGTTASPFAFADRKRPALSEQNSSFRFDTSSSSQPQRQHGRPNKRHKAAPPGPQECFFCLSNPQLATHLIAAIGDSAYLTTAKGPLSTASTSPDLGFPCHMLIIPHAHAPSLALIAEPNARTDTLAEMVGFRTALNSMLAAKAGGKLGSVTWEVSRAGGVHAHWQYMPVSAAMVRRGLVEAAFKVQAENDKYPKLAKRDVGDGAEEENDFFRLKVWAPGSENADEGKEKEMNYVLPLDSSFRFDLQFGRVVMAKLLGLESRIHWQDCGQTHEDEVRDVEVFKKAFKGWDFTLED